MTEQLAEIELTLIDANPDQPRKDFDEEALHQLSESIKATNGVVEPIVVRPRNGRYEIVAGERRWRASQIAELPTIRALVRDMGDMEMALVALVENAVRKDLNVVEEGRYYKMLRDMGLEDIEIARVLGMKEVATVQRKIDIVEKCTDEIVWLTSKGTLNGLLAWRLSRLSPNGQRLAVKKMNDKLMTEAEQMGLIEMIWAQENAIDMFPETKLTDEEVRASRSFADVVIRVIAVCEKLEKMEGDKPGTLAAALSTDLDLSIEKMKHLSTRVGSLRRLLERSAGRVAAKKGVAHGN